jgi:hypothetical protein
MKHEANAVWLWWQRNGKTVASGSLGWFLGLLTATWLLWRRGLIPLALAGAVGWQAVAQGLVVLALPPATNAPSGSNNVSLVCGLFYVAVTCVTAAGGIVCIVKIKRAADCIASNQNWMISNAMNEARAELPPGATPCLSFILVTLSAFEANWTLETSAAPDGPWTPAAEWLALPANLDADIAPQTVWLPPAAAGYFRMKGVR